ncbi:MAG: biotin/lipoyl-binding protein [Oscillospiraceae bacterium]|nr:biotin/lipoyl-binding protein [Oscillospiraceae bacterium]
MKNYKVTVNGNTYEVDVEEVGGAPVVAAVQAAAPVQRSAPVAPKPAAPAPKAEATSAGGAESVLAPLPGTVLSVSVKAGDQVKANQVLLIFEAMKMENEIVATRAGTIKEVFVAKGDMLESGKPVVSIA